MFMKTFFPVRGLKEYTCGFRAYRASIIKQAIGFYQNNFIQLKGLGFTCTLEKIVKLKLLNARIAEIPFVLEYNQKLSESKMVSSITTLGYFTMVILYYWPWGGWKQLYKKKIKMNKIPGKNSQALESWQPTSTKRKIVSIESDNSIPQTITQPNRPDQNAK